MNKEHNPAMKRSLARRFGARFRERFRISSCCLMRTDSATTERIPPGRQSWESATMAWTKRMTRLRISAFYQEQQKSEIASLEARIGNSPWTASQASFRGRTKVLNSDCDPDTDSDSDSCLFSRFERLTN